MPKDRYFKPKTSLEALEMIFINNPITFTSYLLNKTDMWPENDYMVI